MQQVCVARDLNPRGPTPGGHPEYSTWAQYAAGLPASKEECVSDLHPDGFEPESFLEERVSRRRVLKAGGAMLGAAVAGPLLFTTEKTYAESLITANKSNLPYHANTGVKGSILFWHHWSSPLRHGAIRTAIRQFNQHYKRVHVTDVPFIFPDDQAKVLAAVAAGKGMPDVFVTDRPKMWNYGGVHHAFDTLTSLAKRDKITGKEFWPFTWYESTYKGQVYALPYETDCRVMYWNRALFIDAGLNANKGPATWNDLTPLAAKLDHKNGGQYDVVTFNPLWGADLTAWPWDNRTDFQDKHMRPTVNNSRMIQTAEWMKSWVDRYGKPNLDAIASLSTGGKDQFGLGHAATIIDIPGRQSSMNFYGVTFTTKKGDKPFPYWGVGLLPHNTGGKSYSYSGGFSLSMPRNAHRSGAVRDASWEFMKFMSFVGQRTWAQLTFAIPTVPSIARNDSILSAQPHWKTFMQAMALGHAGDRNLYDVLFPGDVIVTGTDAQDAIINGTKSAKDALDAAQAQALQNMKRNGGP